MYPCIASFRMIIIISYLSDLNQAVSSRAWSQRKGWSPKFGSMLFQHATKLQEDLFTPGLAHPWRRPWLRSCINSMSETFSCCTSTKPCPGARRLCLNRCKKQKKGESMGCDALGSRMIEASNEPHEVIGILGGTAYASLIIFEYNLEIRKWNLSPTALCRSTPENDGEVVDHTCQSQRWHQNMHADTKTQASGIHWEINRSKCQKGFVWEWGSPKIPCLIIISFSDMVNFATPPFFGQIRKHKNCLYKPINHGKLSNSVNSFPPKAGQDAPQRRLCRMRSASTARKGQAQKLRFLLYPQFLLFAIKFDLPKVKN